MIDFIKGALIRKEQGSAVIETGCGLGFILFCSTATLSELPESGEVKLYSYLHVKDDGITLFGFRSIEERAMFLRLITVSGVGPKVALALLSGMPLSALALAILTSDTKAVCKVKGIGKKTAERIFLELKEKIEPEELPDTNLQIASFKHDSDATDAVIALKSLGFGQSEAYNAVKKARANASSIEELIAQALKHLST